MNEAAAPAQSLPVQASDGHRFDLQLVRSTGASRTVLLVPALGVSARHYLAFAQQLARQGLHVAVHEWRGHGSSSLRASRKADWGFAELLLSDLPASLKVLAQAGVPVDILAGHSLGGQLASCLVGLHPGIRRLWLIAAGSPWWRSFPSPLRWRLPLVYTALPLIANLSGHLPGRHLGFGGREARGLIADWGRVGRTGRYRIPGDIEQRMAQWHGHCLGVHLANDWMAPASSLTALQQKLSAARFVQQRIDCSGCDPKADHFSWMRQPEAVITALVNNCEEVFTKPLTQP